MERENFSSVKAFLKRAAELEGLIYSYEQTRAMLAHKQEYDVSTEARTVKQYEYGDTIPWQHVMPEEERRVEYGLVFGLTGTNREAEIKNYKRTQKEYARFHSYDEWRKGHTPPDGYPGKKKSSAAVRFTFRSFLGSLIGCGVIGAVVGVLLVWFTDLSFLTGFIISTVVLDVLFWILNALGSTAEGSEPTTEAYLLQKVNYEQAVDERNALLAKELGIDAYCIQAGAEIAPVEAKLREELKRHYENGVVHPKYRNFLAVTQIYEYFDTGRCNTLEGADGAYNLFESELRANTIISQLSHVIQKLEEIKEAMYLLCRAIESTNGLLSEISADIRRVENAVNVNTAAIHEFNAATMYTLNHIG